MNYPEKQADLHTCLTDCFVAVLYNQLMCILKIFFTSKNDIEIFSYK